MKDMKDSMTWKLMEKLARYGVSIGRDGEFAVSESPAGVHASLHSPERPEGLEGTIGEAIERAIIETTGSQIYRFQSAGSLESRTAKLSDTRLVTVNWVLGREEKE